MSHDATATQEVSVTQTVIRCGCSEAARARADWHAWRGLPCPNPRELEELGTVAYWHRNPLRRFAWRLVRRLRGLKPGSINLGGTR